MRWQKQSHQCQKHRRFWQKQGEFKWLLLAQQKWELHAKIW